MLVHGLNLGKIFSVLTEVFVVLLIPSQEILEHYLILATAATSQVLPNTSYLCRDTI